MKQRRWLGRAVIFVLGLVTLTAILIVLRLWPGQPLWAEVSRSRMVQAERGELLRLTLASDGQFRLWVPLEDVNRSLVDAVLLKEDRSFYRHPGVNPVALLRAVQSTYSGGGRQGGSTITMQLARRIHDLDSRQIPGKLKQIALALWLEARYSKHDILEAYLNLVPMGGNIEGVGAASLIYFNRPVAQLSFSQSLALAVIPQRPARGRFDAEMERARLLLLRQWRERQTASGQGTPDKRDMRDTRDTPALDLPVQAAGRSKLPFEAPHLTDQLLAKYTGDTLHSTVSLPMQKLLERLVRQYVNTHRAERVENAAAMVIDTRTQEVKALVGSADYFSTAISGQVNGTAAQRSPGSTLKPFLYGQAIDQGVIHPMSILRDTPTAFGPFQPENFDSSFMGPLTAEDALVRSRNVPAVWLASQLRETSLHEVLRRAGVRNLRSAEFYGLSLVLGGGEISMQELADMYLALAGDGRMRPLRFLRDEPRGEPGAALLSPQAAFIVRDMLRHNPRADGLPGHSGGRQWRVAWKTGTSWGFRDAWSAGIAGPYVVVVWIGNFDGRGNPAFVGQESAAPLFFRIIDALMTIRPQDADPPDPQPQGVSRVAVCRASGDLPNRWCPETRQTFFIPGVSPIRLSKLHRPVSIDTRTGRAVCLADNAKPDPAHTRVEVFEFWPTDMLALFRSAGLPRHEPPPQAEGCHTSLQSSSPDAIASGEAPRIQSPLAAVTYSLRLSQPGETISLSAAAGGDARRIFWFADRTLLGEAEPGKSLDWRPVRAGTYHLHVSDDLGRSDERVLRVEFLP